MTTEEFLHQLEKNLSPLAPEERENALSYYQEYLEEAGEHTASAIEALGSPQSVAQRIIAEIGNEQGFRYSAPKYTAPTPGTSTSGINGGRIALTILVILVTSPIWATILILWASLVFSLAVILLSFAASALIAPIQGAMFIRDGLAGLGLWNIGGGILCLGLTLLLWHPFLKAGIVSTKWLFRLSKKCILDLLGKEETV